MNDSTILKASRHPGIDGQLHSSDQLLQNNKTYNDDLINIGLLPRDGVKYPLRVQLEITSQCNLNCSFCYNSSAPDESTSLDDAMLMSLMDDFGKHNLFEIILSGGEIFTRKPTLKNLLKKSSEYNIRSTVVTNGILLNEQNARFLHDHQVKEVQVSIDGADRKIHDRFRGLEGAWDKTVEGLKRLIDLGVDCTAAMVTYGENKDSVEEFVQFLWHLGVKKVILGDLLLYGRANDLEGPNRLTDEEYEKLFTLAQTLSKDYAGRMQVVLGTDIGFSLRSRLDQKSVSCLIRSDGTVVPSCILPIVMGNIYESSLSEIWNNGLIDLSDNPEVHSYINSKKQNLTKNLNLLRTS